MTSKKRIAVVDNEKLKDLAQKMEIQSICPVNRSGTECISIDEEENLLIDEDTCISCMLCVKVAPNAVSVVNLPTELDQFPIHRYGKNMFALYKLPIPRKGQVIGLVGPNGVGKSTVIKILSGNMKPNCDILNRSVESSEVIGRFKGTELQDYFLQINKIKIAYKPQNIDMIQEALKGNVKSLLQKINPDIDSVVKELEIENLLEKSISDLSGGELQIFAIAATILKGSDFYFFDEPSSYLDVEQRFKVSQVIRKLSEKSYVVVIEHDLALADYLADNVHILYGSPGTFGIVSKPYGVRAGINSYLDGYLKEENMRIRKDPIVFQRMAKVSTKTSLLFNFDKFEKKFKNFSLKTENGDLYKGEVIGILGPNGIGKTTFVKMLAGELKSDSGESLNMKLSYKPQRLELAEEQKRTSVRNFIKNLSKVKRIINIMGVDRLLDRELGSLSGGELQAVFISAALAKDHEIILLDEPSAFLDVEQRLRLAKIIQNWVEENSVSAFIVDHDLQLIDAVSDRLMIFEGKQGVYGLGLSPSDLKNGMNKFLKTMNLSFRRDIHTGRPRANKLGSVLDREQKSKNKYYYS